MKLYVYPTGGKNSGSINPYIRNLRKAMEAHFELIEPHYRIAIPRMMGFLLSTFKADVYVLNWIENSAFGRGGNSGALMSLLGLYILKLRKARIVWVFHNIYSHEGETKWTRRFKKFLFKHSSFIITHSEEAASFAKQYAQCPVYFKNHPMARMNYGECMGDLKECDLFYWSSILPYKGVAEFLSNPLCKTSNKKILIIGKCNNTELDHKIQLLSGQNVIYENRVADFSEIAAQCKRSKYVIFPYIGDSISSSGVLMDTLMMGGVPVGPNRGAFADLSRQGCCITYNNINEVFSLPTDEGNRRRLDPDKVESFINDNTWDAFGMWFYSVITNE